MTGVQTCALPILADLAAGNVDLMFDNVSSSIGLVRNGRLERASVGAKARPQLEAELGMLVIP